MAGWQGHGFSQPLGVVAQCEVVLRADRKRSCPWHPASADMIKRIFPCFRHGHRTPHPYDGL